MPQIELKEIRKTFTVLRRPEGAGRLRGLLAREKQTVRALEEVSFSIEPGELVGYIGPNGAGKSTTVKVMGGILVPEDGECRILGRVPWRERPEHVRHIGVVFGQRSQLWWDVPARDSFELLRDIYGIPADRYRQRMREMEQALEFGPLLRTPVRQLSLGQRMRCEVAAALLHSPEILFLDEPTIGLDAVSKLALREFLREENRRRGITMILTTHDMDDIEALCSRVMTIGRGRLLYDGSLPELRRRYAPLRRMRARLPHPVPAPAIAGARRVEMEEKSCTVWYDPAEQPAQEMVLRLAEALPLTDIEMADPDIDEIIAAMYREMRL